MTKKRHYSLPLVVLGIGVATLASARGDDRISNQKFIPFKVLSQMAVAAESVCADKGHTVSVTVVDRAGTTRVTLVGDGAAAASTHVSYRKAYTAANAGLTTAAFKQLVETPGSGPILSLDPLFIPFGGGVPITIGDRVVGGIGVAGAASSEIDEECARQGIEQLTVHRK